MRERAVDKIDLSILHELCEDSRSTYEKLSSKVGVSVPTVYNRVRKLVRRGIIKKFTIEVDYNKVGYPIRALIGIIVDPKYTIETREELKKVEQVISLVEVTGRFDYILDVVVSDTEALQKLLNERLSKIKGVIKTETMIQTYRFTKTVL
ncbi:MAG: Lrp/AsnC family transcriptional regulator [Candidatus Asgardarchaeia archaeon]